MTDTTAPKKKLTPADWATIVTMVERGEKSVKDLADMFKVSKQALHEGLRKRGVKTGSRVHEVAGAVDDASTAAHKKKVADAHATAARYSKYNDLIVQLTVKRVMDSSQNPGGLAGANAEVLTLKNAMAIVRTARREAWDIQKIDEMLQQSEELAALNVGEYSEEELQAIREANEESYRESMDELDLNKIGQGDEDDEADYPEEEDDDDSLVEIPEDGE